MAPSASMLFLSYHQLHHGPADAPHGKDGADGFRFGLGNVFFSLGVLAPKRRDAAPEATVFDGKQKQRARRSGGEEEEPATLASKFDEAVRLSCWSS
ncbi:hypothetical protein CFC21_056518 [Triticum aestivum]|uniref:Uncharacterized protein n=2 Tax=Triticum aestivum TaxID=4565 RepID=A0A9R1GIP7_WHEAT|nr:uncharacterized protein LOC119294898 [Triticum dicoccoides]XP_044368222.1 uncharacterized protein LOC123090932 [Triticum aestivum]KAF7047614.1 hypothetical protein CFC21_056518 [Triticum aestivum]